MYRMLGVPVIPVAVNSGIVYPPHRWVKWSGTNTYRIGETIPAGLPREEAEDRVWRAINALNPPEALEAGEAAAVEGPPDTLCRFALMQPSQIGRGIDRKSTRRNSS